MTEERKKEAFGMKLKERKDEIIALYLSRSHTHHPLFSAQQTWNEKKGERKKDWKRAAYKAEHNTKILSNVKGNTVLGSVRNVFVI